jgi:hypothetical protein
MSFMFDESDKLLKTLGLTIEPFSATMSAVDSHDVARSVRADGLPAPGGIKLTIEPSRPPSSPARMSRPPIDAPQRVGASQPKLAIGRPR